MTWEICFSVIIGRMPNVPNTFHQHSRPNPLHCLVSGSQNPIVYSTHPSARRRSNRILFCSSNSSIVWFVLAVLFFQLCADSVRNSFIIFSIAITDTPKLFHTEFERPMNSSAVKSNTRRISIATSIRIADPTESFNDRALTPFLNAFIDRWYMPCNVEWALASAPKWCHCCFPPFCFFRQPFSQFHRCGQLRLFSCHNAVYRSVQTNHPLS